MNEKISAILTTAEQILKGAGHQSTGPDANLGGYIVTRETYTHPDTAARIFVKEAFEAWVDSMPAPRDWDMIESQQAILITAAAAIGIKNINL